jgi:3-oxoacyl-[acyl-carrier protein] reductase
MSLTGKVAVITGASRGIGAATAKALASRGAQVVVNYLKNATAANEVVKEIQISGGKAIAVQADVRRQEDISRLVDQALQAFGHIDILVSNANIHFAIKPFADLTWDEFAQKLNDELKAAFEVTKAVMPVMVKQNYGRIVYVSSGLGKRAMPGFISHGTAKAGLDAFAKYIAKEYASHGITVNVVAPGMVETDATAHIPLEAKRSAAANVPLGRIAVPDDVARVIAFLVSDESAFMTGTYIPVDGGLSM